MVNRPQSKNYCYLSNMVCRTNNMIERSIGYSYSMIVRVQLYIDHFQSTMIVIIILLMGEK